MPWPLREMYLAVAISSSVKGFSFCRQGRHAEQQRRWKGRQAGKQAGSPSVWRLHYYPPQHLEGESVLS